MMNQDEFREFKETGVRADDAGQQNDVVDQDDEVIVEDQENQETEVEQEQEEQQDDLPPLSEKEKTAFEKRMEREKAKLQEKLEAELKSQYEQQYGKHKQVIDMLGGDPDAIEKRIRENQLAQEAQRLADVNGWDDETTRWYVEQQKQKQEHEDLKIQMQIYRLKDNPDYAGISQMESEIRRKITQTNGLLSVEEAFWAVGGPKRAEQIRLEAKVREAEKRKQQPRTVLTDAQVSVTAEKPLPADVLRDAERMGISPAEARKLMNKEPAKDLAEWRKQKAK